MQNIKCRKCRNQIICKNLLGIELNHIRFHFLQALQVTEDINLIREIVNYQEFKRLSDKELQDKIEIAMSYRDICYWGENSAVKVKVSGY